METLDDLSDSRDNLDWQPYNLAEEQTDRLLPSEGHEKGRSSRIPPSARGKAILVALALALLTVVLLAVGLVRTFRTASVNREQLPVTFRRPATDYILSDNWDFQAQSVVRHYQWTVTDEFINPDGVYRPMILVNGQYPGPVIECNEGDRLIIDVDNQSVNATSFHWHGLFQNGSNWMDGTVGVTQCPIAPRNKFTYDFSVTGQWGTYWYHSHHSAQTADGLFGPLIVHSINERQYQKLTYATDRVLMVHDHYHDLSSALLPHYLANDRENAEPIPDGALINGANIRDCSAVPHRSCDNTTAGQWTLDLAPHQNHRLRIINTGTLAEFQIQIDEHPFAVTEVDGTDVLPSHIHRLLITPAQRYSIVITTNVTASDSFWLRARMIETCFRSQIKNDDMIPEVRAQLKYTDAAPVPSSKDWSDAIDVVCKDLSTTELFPIPAIVAPKQADHLFLLEANFEIGDWRLSRGTFNHTSWMPNLRSPTLNRVIEGWHSGNESFRTPQDGINTEAFSSDKELVMQISGIKTIDLLIQNFDEGNHPMHLHGYKFFVMGQGEGFFDSSTYDALDYSNPLRRDTASVGGYGWLLIRLVTDNPGAWAFHCHITWHTESGLLMQFLTRPDIVGKWELPGAVQDLCKAEGLEKGARIGDEVYFGNIPP